MIDAWMETIVEGEEIKIIRHNIPDEDGIYEVYRDHKFLKKVKGNTFIDREPLNGPRSYRVIGLSGKRDLLNGELIRLRLI